MQARVLEEKVRHLVDMSDDDFFEFCARNSDYRIERTAEGSVIIMAGTGWRTGARNSRLTRMLDAWAEQDGRGVASDSSTLFRLPDSAMRSADAAWVDRSRLEQFTDAQLERFLPLCPDFVVELTSPSDRINAVKYKMVEWMANTCRLGWILEVERRRVHVYRPDSVEILENPTEIAGEGPVAGFVLDLRRIWEPGY